MNIPPKPDGVRQPPNAVEHWRVPKKPGRGEADQKLIDEAIAEKRVTVCRPARRPRGGAR